MQIRWQDQSGLFGRVVGVFCAGLYAQSLLPGFVTMSEEDADRRRSDIEEIRLLLKQLEDAAAREATIGPGQANQAPVAPRPEIGAAQFSEAQLAEAVGQYVESEGGTSAPQQDPRELLATFKALPTGTSVSQRYRSEPDLPMVATAPEMPAQGGGLKVGVIGLMAVLVIGAAGGFVALRMWDGAGVTRYVSAMSTWLGESQVTSSADTTGRRIETTAAAKPDKAKDVTTASRKSSGAVDKKQARTTLSKVKSSDAVIAAPANSISAQLQKQPLKANDKNAEPTKVVPNKSKPASQADAGQQKLQVAKQRPSKLQDARKSGSEPDAQGQATATITREPLSAVKSRTPAIGDQGRRPRSRQLAIAPRNDLEQTRSNVPREFMTSNTVDVSRVMRPRPPLADSPQVRTVPRPAVPQRSADTKLPGPAVPQRSANAKVSGPIVTSDVKVQLAPMVVFLAGNVAELGLAINNAQPIDSFILVFRGVPKGVKLTKGSPIGKDSWFMPLSQSKAVRLKADDTFSGVFDLKIELVTLAGQVVSSAKTNVRVVK